MLINQLSKLLSRYFLALALVLAQFANLYDIAQVSGPQQQETLAGLVSTISDTQQSKNSECPHKAKLSKHDAPQTNCCKTMEHASFCSGTCQCAASNSLLFAESKLSSETLSPHGRLDSSFVTPCVTDPFLALIIQPPISSQHQV